MIPEVQKGTEVRQPVEQEQPPGGSLPSASQVPPAGTIETPREAPPPEAPPTPPRGGLVAGIQRMPPAGRWALGLALAFLSGVAFLFDPYISNFGPDVFIVAAAGMFVLALAAGFVLTSWWAALALAVAGAAGGLVGSWALTQVNPGGMGNGGAWDATLAVFPWFAIVGLGPIILLLFAGVGLGKYQGLTLGQPHVLSATETLAGRWIAAIAPLIAAGYIAPNVVYIQGDAMSILTDSIYAAVFAATCLLAGWLLRSWWGFVLAPVVYAGATDLTMYLRNGGGDWAAFWSFVWSPGFGLYVVLLAVVMSAIGTAIGVYRARRER